MRTTITLDDELIKKARAFTGLTETSAVVRAALVAFVQREAACRLAALGGSDPSAWTPPRRRFDPE